MLRTNDNEKQTEKFQWMYSYLVPHFSDVFTSSDKQTRRDRMFSDVSRKLHPPLEQSTVTCNARYPTQSTLFSRSNMWH